MSDSHQTPSSISSGSNRLAVLGGQPAFKSPLHVGQPNIGDSGELHNMLSEILERRWLTNNGPVVQQFERRVESLLGVRNCISVCNATVGLQLLVRALGLSGKVIVPSFTFCATAQALAWCGVKPIFADIEPDFHTIDVDKIESLITEGVTAIMGVHLWGNACNIDQLESIAAKHGLKLAFDAAHAFGCTYHGTSLGNFGAAEVFSFHATKYLNCFEGGVVTTNDDKLAEELRLTCNFGFKEGRVTCLGTNAKMSEISAAMGLVSLDAMEDFRAVNVENRERYQVGLSGIAGVKLCDLATHPHHNCQYVVIEIDESLAGLSRDQIARVLKAENVLARSYFEPGVHRVPPFDQDDSAALPVTEALCETALALPTGTGVNETSIAQICDLIRQAVKESEQVCLKLNH